MEFFIHFSSILPDKVKMDIIETNIEKRKANIAEKAIAMCFVDLALNFDLMLINPAVGSLKMECINRINRIAENYLETYAEGTHASACAKKSQEFE